MVADSSPAGMAAARSHRSWRRAGRGEAAAVAARADRSGAGWARPEATIAAMPSTSSRQRDGDQHALRRQRDGRLDDERVGDETGEARRVRGRVQPPGVAAPPGEPGREQRARRREQEDRRSGGQPEDEQDVERLRHRRVAEPGQVRGGQDRRDDDDSRQDQMEQPAAPLSKARDHDVRVQVAQEQDAGEEAQRRGPDRRRSAEHRQAQGGPPGARS